MATEARFNTANRFNPDFRYMIYTVLFYWFCFVLCLFLTVFSVFQNFQHKKNVFCEILCLSIFFPNVIFVLFSVLWKTGDFSIHVHVHCASSKRI